MPNVDRDPNHLYPAFRAKVATILTMMQDWSNKHWDGRQVLMFEGFRSQARQDELYKQGRFGNPGPVVTKTKTSMHTSCMAADIITMDPRTHDWTWDGPQAFWDYLNHCAHVVSLEQTKDYSTFDDQPHVQWPMKDTAEYKKAKLWRDAAGINH